MKRAIEDEDNDLEEGEEHEQEEGELHDDDPVAGPSTFVLPPPPPPPPILRLVVHHSSQNPSANLLSPHHTLALIQETTTIGRDKSYEPRIRLKTLEVSRTHATIFQQEEVGFSQEHVNQADSSSINAAVGQWYIVDNASTHGTYIRKMGEEQYTRLSEKGKSSLPRQLKHMDTIKVANQRFIVHLHEAGDITCESCSVTEDRSNLIPLLESEAGPSSNKSTLEGATSTGHTAMSEHEAKTFTKEEKKQNFRSNMQSLRKNLLTGGGSTSSAATSKPAKNPQGRMEGSGNSEEDSNASTSEIPQQPRYVDRAKLRRSIHPPSYGLSDADPPHLSKRSKLASPPVPSKAPEPSYGPGAALFQKMLHNNGGAAHISTVESGNESSSSGKHEDTNRSAAAQPKEVKMGKVIEVRTMAERSAGLGSGSIREGVEQHSNPTDWRDAARQRRWREANR